MSVADHLARAEAALSRAKNTSTLAPNTLANHLREAQAEATFAMALMAHEDRHQVEEATGAKVTFTTADLIGSDDLPASEYEKPIVIQQEDWDWMHEMAKRYVACLRAEGYETSANSVRERAAQMPWTRVWKEES